MTWLVDSLFRTAEMDFLPPGIAHRVFLQSSTIQRWNKYLFALPGEAGVLVWGSGAAASGFLVAEFLMQVFLGKEVHSISLNSCFFHKTRCLVCVTSPLCHPPPSLAAGSLSGSRNYGVCGRLSFQALQKFIKRENVGLRG